MAHGLRPLMTGQPLSFNRAGLIPLNLARPPHVQTDAGHFGGHPSPRQKVTP